MTFQTDIASDVQNLAVGNIVNLYELDFSNLPGAAASDILYFTESIDDDYTPVVFDGQEYTPIHMQTSGWQMTGTESLPRPKVVVSNVLLTFASYINSFDDLVGSKFTRRRTLEKYLDGKPEANPNAQFAPDIFKIRTMPQKTKAVAEFELYPWLDQEGIKVPKRQILRDFCRQTYRTWNTNASTFDYTKATCPYVGIYCYDRLGNYTADCASDNCGKELSDCEMRFAGNKAEGNTVYIQETAPDSTNAENTYWLNISVSPVIWSVVIEQEIPLGPFEVLQEDEELNTIFLWTTVKPQPLPTWAFPSVARFRL